MLRQQRVAIVGDLMSLVVLPGVAQVAIQSGRHAARTIAQRVAGDTTRRPFRYRDLGTQATISRFRALAALGRIEAAGFGWPSGIRTGLVSAAAGVLVLLLASLLCQELSLIAAKVFPVLSSLVLSTLWLLTR
jgi:hypothetical protein